MTTLPDVPNVLKVSLNWGIEGDTMGMTVHHFSYTGAPPSPANCATMAASAVSTAESAFQALASNSVGVLAARVLDLSAMDAGDAVGGTPWVGTRGTALLAPGTAALVNHSIARRYRGGKPRSYLPLGVAADVATTGLWSNSFVTAVDAAWGAWVSAMEGAGAGVTITNLCNVSYYQGFTNVAYGSPTKYRRVPTPRATPLVGQVTGHTTSKQIAAQRRRNRNA
jgi:hypothetical protein